MLCKCVLLALFVAQVGAAGICAKESDYTPNTVYEVTCKGVTEANCKGGATWDDKKCKAQWSSLAGHTKSDGSELEAICKSIGGTGEKMTCAAIVAFASMSGFKADATTCAVTNAKTTQKNSFLTIWLKDKCCGTGQDSCGSLSKAVPVCAKASDFKPDKVITLKCSGPTKEKCLGLNTEFKGTYCEIASGTSNTKDDGTELAARCKSMGGIVAEPMKCGAMASMYMPGVTKMDATTCAVTNAAITQKNSFLTAHLQRMGCCGAGQDACASLSTFEVCKKSSDYMPLAVVEVKCANVVAASCTGASTSGKESFELADQDGEKVCKANVEKSGGDAAAGCKSKGGVPFGTPTTCSTWKGHFFANMKQDATTCAAKNSLMTAMTNAQMSDYMVQKGCCKNSGASCCGDYKACQAEAAAAAAAAAAKAAAAKAAAAKAAAAATETTSGAFPAHAKGVFVMMVVSLTTLLALR